MTISNTKIVAILNITPDSFSDGGKYSNIDQALNYFEDIKDKVDIIDIGAESTRPNAVSLNSDEEWGRLEPVLKGISSDYYHKISIDTYKSSIAKKALEIGIRVINDVSGLDDKRMGSLISEYPESKIVIGHHHGIPPSKEPHPTNPNIVDDTINYFENKIKIADISPNQVILDPGLGFGKNTEENLLIIKSIQKLKRHFNLPIFVGASRKRFIREYWGVENQEIGTGLINYLLMKEKVDYIRTHDIHAVVQLQEFCKAFS